jgi:hypothetical protein
MENRKKIANQLSYLEKRIRRWHTNHRYPISKLSSLYTQQYQLRKQLNSL